MKIHEYQAKQLLAQYGVKVPSGRVVFSVAEAQRAYEELGGGVVAVKSQIHAGGRGKGKLYDPQDRTKLLQEGGVKIANSGEEVERYASRILGKLLVTQQTGPEGQLVKRLWLEKASAIARELYLGIVVDRAKGLPCVMASTAGGMEIEEVARQTPEKILREWADPALGLLPFQAQKLAFGLGLAGEAFAAGVKFTKSLFRAFVELHCSLAEINPLVVTTAGEVVALDAKLTLDDNALEFRPDLLALRDLDEEHPVEVAAKNNGLSYVALEGNIGCLVNGAGLAMSTMDVIKLYGGEPANFLDVGGGADAGQVKAAFKIILSDPKVRAVLVNIFGGIMRCDVIAEGIIAAVREVDLKVPLVVRLEGTNVERGRKLLAESGLKLIPADDLDDAAKKVVAAAG